ncbi:M56 family metallopeptidase [Flavobacterium pallidum]|uniref:Peptidase M56 domain-containing protein n=1 Tax=Flavobacterium pallidum TaxID=2172098 RepID=A0A2S1SIX2_9FLAO|nr:M56 family metallopeptidase [Flavobacterium pallidum]AWI26356.1 hypothetical protein HYN49_10830 [Flavobacterium pallidum]
MDLLITYTLKSAGLLLFFSIAYHVLLRKETFFRANRFFLLSGLLVSIVLPWITYTKIVWMEAIAMPVQNTAKPMIMDSQSIVPQTHEPINWLMIIGVIYAVGALFFIGQFALDYRQLRKVLKENLIRSEGKFRIVETREDLSPFSYFNYIVYNPAHYTATESAHILEHEKTHCRQYHSIDMMFMRLLCILFWFNPIIWLYKKQLVQNLEFIADAEANRLITDRKNYQITLLKVTARENCLSFTNPFYQSLIKKRIIMLNKKQSRSSNLLKYGVAIPALLLFMLQFQVKVIAQTKQPKVMTNDPKVSKIEIHVDAASAEKDLNEMTAFFKDEFGATLQFSEYKANALKQITGLKVTLKNRYGITKKYEVSGKMPIDPFTIYVDVAPDGKEDFGFSTATKNSNGLVIHNPGREEDSIYATPIRKEAQSATDLLSENKQQRANANKQMLYIINGKDYYPDMIKDQVITTSEFIEQLSPEEGLKRYGRKGKDGVLIFHGTSAFNKKGKEEPNKISAPTTITLENGDEAVFFSKSKMKVPGAASVDFTDSNLVLIINGVRYDDANETMEGLDLRRVKSIQIVESANPDDKDNKNTKVLMQLK